MRSWSIPAGRVFGVEIRIHLTFLFLLFFIWLTEAAPHGSLHPGRGLALLFIIFGSVILHELGHAYINARSGLAAKAIILLPIGGITLLDETRLPVQSGVDTWKRDVRSALAGPTVNLVIGFIAAMAVLGAFPEAQLWAKPWVISTNLPRSLVWVNFGLAGLNLLPAYPMDGGRILRALFARQSDAMKATRRAVSIGQAFAMLFMFVGMFWNVWLTMIGFFLFVAGQLEERSVVFQSVLETVRLEDVMLTDFATLSPADTLEDALDKAVHSLQDDFPVIRGSDMVGVISKQKILEALRVEGNGYVQAVMNRIFDVAQKTESLASAFRKLTSRNISIIPVVEDQRLVGIITLQNLMHSMALLAESRKLRKAALSS
jgi:Zn-dependent protease/CBS domain-containing protein